MDGAPRLQRREEQRMKPSFAVPIRLAEHPLLRLVCFPFGGAGAAAYWDWKQWLPAHVELWAIRLAGRESRFREPFADVAEVVADALRVELSALPPAPVVYFGHSMGAGLAHLVLQKHSSAGDPLPALLIASGRHPPDCADEADWANSSDAALLENVKSLGGVPSEILGNADFLAVYLSRLRADYLLNNSISANPGPPLEVAITAINGEQDPLVRRDKIEGWQSYTRRAFHSVWMTGDHFFLNQQREQFSSVIIEELARLLRDSAEQQWSIRT